jgi:hypothetical protein
LLSLAVTIYIGGVQGILFGQSVGNKTGGICFRVDDNQSIDQWQQYSDVFEKYGYNFTFEVNAALFENNSQYVGLVQELIQSGHELADHTPNHITLFFTTDTPNDYINRAGVDHIFGNTIALKYDSFDTSKKYPGDGFADLSNNMLISKKNGAFKDFSTSNLLYSGIYLPTFGLLASFSKFSNTDTSSVDTLYLTTFWGEPISLSDEQNIPIKLIGIYDVRMNIDALALLAERSLTAYWKLGIPRPVTWIQPGGSFPQINPQEAKAAFGDRWSFRAAAVYPNASLKCYNEYDPLGDRRYAMEWGDFMEDASSFDRVKRIIADRIARHYYAIGHSHFSSLLGDWDGYLIRMDSLLNWCKRKDIAVKTYKEIAAQLFDTPQNAYTNIFPPLNVDLDENGIPDGYTTSYGFLDTTSGVEQSGNRSYSIQRTASIFSISMLAGLEKGENDFIISTRGGIGDSVDVKFVFSEVGKTFIFRFPAASSQWTRYGCEQSTSSTKTLTVPNGVSNCYVYISCSSYKSDTVRVSGFELRKKIYQAVKFISTPDTMVRVNDQYKYRTSTVAKNTQDTLTYKLLSAPTWLSIDQNGLLTGITPAQSGLYPVQIIVQDKHASVDTQSFTLSVVKRKWLYVNSQNISLGDIHFGTKKDTSVAIYNTGLDTITISSIEKSDNITLFSQTKKIMPQQSIVETIRINADSLGDVNGWVCFLSDANDTITISLKGNVVNSVAPPSSIPSDYALYQNYPNPFNPTTTISYALPSASIVKIEVFDILGRKVCTLLPEQPKRAGTYSIAWSGKNEHGYPAASGVYFARFIAKDNSKATSKIIVEKLLLLR